MAQHKASDKGGMFSYKSIKETLFLLLCVFLIRTFGFGLYQVPSGSMETTMLVGERFFADKFSYLFRAPAHSEVISFNEPTFHYSKNPLKRLFEEYVWGPSNWTKRIIGMPGDRIKGTIENGKPVVYRNDVKLEESYVNKYPLIHVWRKDLDTIRAEIEKDTRTLISDRKLDICNYGSYVEQCMMAFVDARSYDPNKPYEKQEFYRFPASRVVMDEEGKPFPLIEPGTPCRASRLHEKQRVGNYWDGSDEFYVELGPDQYWVMGDNRLGSKDCRTFGPISKRLIHGKILFRIWSVDSNESWWILDLLQHPIDFWSRVRWYRFFQWIK